MKKVTSVTIWNDSAGRRASVTYSEIDEATHSVVRDNVRANFILLSESEIASTDAVIKLCQDILDAQ